MSNGWPAKSEFRFNTRLDLMEVTGRRAANLEELLRHLREVDGATIFNHSHNFLTRMGYMDDQPTSDFAIWAEKWLLEPTLAERLAGVDPTRHPTIRSLREKLIEVIEDHLASAGPGRKVARAHEFHFLRAVSFVFPTEYVASNLYEFAEALKVISQSSLLFHFFDSRIRLEGGRSDFAVWLDESVGSPELAESIDRLDVYTRTLESLRAAMVGLIEEKLYGKLRRGRR